MASWDSHHVDLIGGFATTMLPQGYQFELVDESSLREPVDGLSLRLATRDDLAYLMAQDFVVDYDEPLRKGQVRIAERHAERVGIGMYVAHPISDRAVDIGMYTDPSARREGVGSSLLALLAREALDSGRRLTTDRPYSARSVRGSGSRCVTKIWMPRRRISMRRSPWSTWRRTRRTRSIS